MALVEDLIDTKCRSQLPHPKLQASGEIIVTLDSDKLANVLYHLISNAQQASEQNGEVVIRIEGLEHERPTDAASTLLIEISDNGEGMSAEFVQNKLFVPFETTKGNAGMGIGAYDAKSYIESIGGSITVSSELGKGSVFSLHIPIVS